MTRSSRVVETSGSLGEELQFFHKTCGSVDKVTKRAFRGKSEERRVRLKQTCIYIAGKLRRVFGENMGGPDHSEHFCVFPVENIF